MSHEPDDDDTGAPVAQVVDESSMLDDVDPKYRKLLTIEGRRAYTAGTLIKRLEAPDLTQTEIKAVDAIGKLFRYLDEATDRQLLPAMLDRLIDSNERITDLLTSQETGAQRVSTAPTLKRRDSSKAN